MVHPARTCMHAQRQNVCCPTGQKLAGCALSYLAGRKVQHGGQRLGKVHLHPLCHLINVGAQPREVIREASTAQWCAPRPGPSSLGVADSGIPTGWPGCACVGWAGAAARADNPAPSHEVSLATSCRASLTVLSDSGRRKMSGAMTLCPPTAPFSHHGCCAESSLPSSNTALQPWPSMGMRC